MPAQVRASPIDLTLLHLLPQIQSSLSLRPPLVCHPSCLQLILSARQFDQKLSQRLYMISFLQLLHHMEPQSTQSLRRRICVGSLVEERMDILENSIGWILPTER